MAAKYLTENRFDKVLIFRPLQAVGSKSLGYLPGSVSEKTDPYAQPIIDTFTELLGPKALDYYVKSKKIEIGSIALSRGSSYNSTLLILDEVQNMSKIEVLTLLTRMDFNTKIIITGDQSQSDLNTKAKSGLDYCLERLKDLESVGIVKFTKEDIQRNKLIGDIIDSFED
jgi:phosphate starvation-inducible PhoH-like protein